MVLVNKKMLVGGMLMIIVGLVLTISINDAVPVGQAGMTEEEVIDLLIGRTGKRRLQYISRYFVRTRIFTSID